MKITLFLLFTIILLESCHSQHLNCLAEIGFIYTLEDETDREIICKTYEKNRKLFFTYKNDSTDYGTPEIDETLINSGVSEKSKNLFIDSWKSLSIAHREQTHKRDSIYKEGVKCLNLVIETKSHEFNLYLDKTRENVKSNLTPREISVIQRGIRSYRQFNIDKKNSFRKEETMLLGSLGGNIVSYNQLSFEIIETFMTSQYHFGLKNNYSETLLEFYDENPQLVATFDKYRILEERIVEHITSDECFKRIGILRYYDGLNNERKEKAIKVNMLMNYFK